MLKRLKHYQASALTHDKAAAVCIKWTGGMLRIIIVVSAQSLHRAEASNSSARDTCLSTTSYHYISIAALNYLKCITNIISTSSTCSNNAGAWSLKAKCYRYMASSHVTNHHWNEEWANFGRTLIKQLLILAMHGLNTANTAAYEGTNTLKIFLFQIKLCILNSQLCGCYCKLCIAVNTL